jgi:hypothetical protein
MHLDADNLLDVGLRCVGYSLGPSTKKMQQKFRRIYGIEPVTASDVLTAIGTDDLVPDQYFFAVLYWMRKYGTDKDIIRHFGIGSTNTFRRFTQKYLKSLQTLFHEKVIFDLAHHVLCM